MENLLIDYGVNNLIGTNFWESLQKKLNDLDIEKKLYPAGVGDIDFKQSKEILKRLNGTVDKKIRDSKILFLGGKNFNDLHSELFNLILDYNQNRCSWNYDIIGTESMQYGVYSEGGFYNWHRDNYKDSVPFNMKKSLSGNNTIMVNRKISVSIFLNDPDEYEGGELDIEFRSPSCKDKRYDTFKLPKGSIVVFPSSSWHRVRPVTSGVRKSLVAWIFGPPFK
tara:strand:- start:50 stop:718 length:669 start_codon:yes stop_codon:yes gene_type:complete